MDRAHASLRLAAAAVGGLFLLSAAASLGLGLVPFYLRDPAQMLAMPPLTSAGLGLLLLYLDLPRRPGETATILLVGALGEAWLAVFRYRMGGSGLALVGVGGAWGGLCWVALLARLRERHGPERRRTVCYAMAGALVVLGFLAAESLVVLTDQAHPLVMDLFAYKIDCAAGFSPSFLVTGLVRRLGLEIPSALVYHQLSALMLATLLVMMRVRRLYFDPVRALWVAAVLGVPLYNVYPVIGLTGLYPAAYLEVGARLPVFTTPPPVDPPRMLEAALIYARNGMPSMHTAWILIVAACFLRCQRSYVRALAVLVAVLTAAGIFVSGHYLIDVVVAFPLALASLALCSRSRAAVRLACATLGLMLTGICLWSLTTWPEWLCQHGGLTLTGELGVIVVTAAGERWLAGAST